MYEITINSLNWHLHMINYGGRLVAWFQTAMAFAALSALHPRSSIDRSASLSANGMLEGILRKPSMKMEL